ncbi:hypothetical protein ABVT39_027963 [Epinephelus coioides]
MLQASREIVKEVIQEEENGLQEEIKRAISLIKITLGECTKKLRDHEDGLNKMNVHLEAIETRFGFYPALYICQ